MTISLPPALSLSGITKRYPLVVANDQISLDLHWGEVLALVGENGAGKSTLMNIVYGLVQPDQGEICCQGQPVQMKSPTEAIRLGIGMVHQHFMLVETLTVWENVVLGLEPQYHGMIDRTQARSKVQRLVNQLGFTLDVESRIADLPVGLRQRVEILKAIYREARILILDEPTAVLTPQEAQELFVFLRRFVEGSPDHPANAVIFISHKLDEVLDLADRITVIRDGRVVDTVPSASTDQASLARLMVGREVVLTVPRAVGQSGAALLTIEELTVTVSGRPVVDHVSLTLHQGEILGIAGIEGNGQTELIEALSGLRSFAGSIRYQNQVLPPQSRSVRRWGLGHIPEDRNVRGLILDFWTRDNTILGDQGRRPFRGWLGMLFPKAIDHHATQIVADYDIRPRGITLAARRYSGGNAQKMIIGRELSGQPKVLIAAQPTRGVDIGAIEFIHQQMINARDQGMAILLVSADLNEILSLSDRIVVMHAGRLVGELANPPGATASIEALGLWMGGVPTIPA